MPNNTFEMSAVLDARKFLATYLTPTRLVRAASLDAASGARVSLKLEIENPTATFKVRGGLNALRRCTQQSRIEGVVTSSTGNHGVAIAFAAREMNLRSRIYLPENPNPVKRDRIAKLGAEIVEAGRDLEESRTHAAKYSQERGWPLIVDVDDPAIAAGAATIACEVLEQAPATDVIVVPVGDSNLIRGVAFAAKQIRPAVRIIGVQAEGAPAYYRSWKEHRALDTPNADTMADGLATRTTTEDNVAQLNALVDDIRLISDGEMLRAIAHLILNEHTVAEPAGAAATAALLKSAKEFAGKNVVLLVTGANIAPDILRRAVESNL
ncbi:MAG: pyridoxal-phosphate dependent enzyme [Candidatus Acidiferrales bacterium]